jgi:predicted nucleic acid-binding protein
MTVVVDANILISAIINPSGTIPFLLFNTNDAIDFVAPQFIIEEIELHQSKIIAVANISTPTFTALF